MLVLMAQCLVGMAQAVSWDKITDWSPYLTDTEMGEVTEYAVYDVDGDGVPEVFVRDSEGAYAFFVGGGGEIKCVQSVMFNMHFLIRKGQPYVQLQGSCGTGCVTDEFMKIEGSRVVSHGQRVSTYSPEGERSDECYLFKDGDSKEISNTLYEKLCPKKTEAFDMDDLEWVKAPANPNVVTTELHAQRGDTIILRDGKGYLYQIMSPRSVGVAPGGAYTGNIVFPAKISYDGDTYNVTTVRRGALWKKAGASNIGVITSVKLPESVTLVGADAFRGNASLKSVTYGKDVRIEVRSFWGCPNLQLNMTEPAFAYVTPFWDEEENPLTTDMKRELLSTYYMPTEESKPEHKKYSWVFLKYHHAGVSHTGWMNLDKGEDAMACWCANLQRVKAAKYSIRDMSNIDTMFKGYMNGSQNVLLADNAFVATHEFPMFSRYVWGEEKVKAPQSFVQTMEKKYGRKAKYCYEVGKLLYSTDEKLIITEFKVTNREAKLVLSWLKDGKEVCNYEMKRALEPDEDENESVWDIDDDGDYGIPTLCTVARDENGNIELFLEHDSPECSSFMHLVQKGNKMESVSEDNWYLWY